MCFASYRGRSFLILIAVFFLLFPSLAAKDLPSSLVKRQTAVHKKVSRELVNLAKTCSSCKAYGEAGDHLRTALLIAPGEKTPKKELEKIVGRKDAPNERGLERIAREREKTTAKCAELLLEMANFSEKKGCSELFEVSATILYRHFPESAKATGLDLVYFEPYLRWVRPDTADHWLAGYERIDGKWCDREAVKELNAKHAKWSNPWVLKDEVHEVRTTAPLRDALAIMAYTTEFRKFFFSFFAGFWDLRQPHGTLPVIVTVTQEEFRDKLRKTGSGLRGGQPQGGAYYVWSNYPLNPCLVTFEPLMANDETYVVNLGGLLPILRHELTHQMAYEFTKYCSNDRRLGTDYEWVTEGLASLMECFELGKQGWGMNLNDMIPFGKGYTKNRLAYCKENVESLPKLKSFIRRSWNEGDAISNYCMAASLTYFFMEGEEGRYREPFLKLLMEVHKVNADPLSFKNAFGDIDFGILQTEWEDFIQAMKLERMEFKSEKLDE